MREIPLADQHEALAFGEALFAGGQDILILLTGVGTRLLITTLATRRPREEVVAALGRLTLICRRPKPIAALKEIGLVPALVVPEPKTWRDLLSALDEKLAIAGKRVAVQEYGARNEELLAGLRQRGAHVTTVPVYGWALPEDTAPLRLAIERVVAGEVEPCCSAAPRRSTTSPTWPRRSGRRRAAGSAPLENGPRLDRTDHDRGASAIRRRTRPAARTSQDRAPGGRGRPPGHPTAGAQAAAGNDRAHDTPASRSAKRRLSAATEQGPRAACVPVALSRPR